MYPHTHIIISIIFFMLVLILFSSIGIFPVILMFLSSILIDFDHYMLYIDKKHDFSLKKAYTFHATLPRNHKPALHLFHTLEFLILVAIFSLYIPIFSFILAGMLFHSILDLIELSYDKRTCCREYFLTRYLFSKKSRYL